MCSNARGAMRGAMKWVVPAAADAGEPLGWCAGSGEHLAGPGRVCRERIDGFQLNVCCCTDRHYLPSTMRVMQRRDSRSCHRHNRALHVMPPQLYNAPAQHRLHRCQHSLWLPFDRMMEYHSSRSSLTPAASLLPSLSSSLPASSIEVKFCQFPLILAAYIRSWPTNE